ncbi:hypothetical protein [Photobacterium leiognathi]|uniref:hypothetical protein n=1 Tax=Photobacterium leiognathi TaxID=553611 RepID=UPI002982711C|nr:hypothetical protein [Photobacterium leiognathi]
MARTVGVTHQDGVSPFLKCRISQDFGGALGEVTVTGYLTEQCEMELRSVWESPFAQDTIGDTAKGAKPAAIGQTYSENTTRTLWNSQQTWEGTEPPELTMTIKLIARNNAKQEVNAPIMYLLMMASPELLNSIPVDVESSELGVDWDPSAMSLNLSNIGSDKPVFNSGFSVSGVKTGRIPAIAMFEIGGRIMLPMRISSVSYDVNAPKTPTGDFAYNTVTITAAPKRMFNRSDIPKYFS